MSTAGPRRTVSLQTLLALLSALATLPVIAFAAWLLQLVWQSGQSDARRDLQQMAATLATALDREVAGSVRELQRIAEFPTLGTRELAAFHAYARELVELNAGWDDLVLTDARGLRVLLDSSRPFGEPVVPPVALPRMADVARTGRPIVSDVHDATEGGLAVRVAVPVLRDGAVRYVLSARLSPRELSGFVGAQLQRDGAVASVIDRDFRIVARSRDAARFLGHPIDAALREAFSAERGIRRLVSLDGLPVLAAWERMPSGWTVAIGVPVAAFDAQRARAFGGLLAFGLAVLAAGVALSLLLGRRISAAVDAVAADAGRLAAGEPVARRRSRIRQVVRLFDSLHEASRVLRDEARERERAVAALREADRRKDEFLAVLGHELRNPLAPLRNALGVLARTVPAGTPPRQAVEVSARQLHRLTRLVEDLLDVSRITQGKIVLKRESIAVGEPVAEAVDAVRPAIEQRRQRLTVRVPASAPRVLADPVRLVQVFENLLSNASKYTDPGGAIDVDVEDAGEVVRVRVRDTGIGMPPGQLERVFERFAQLEASRDRAQGGLGLGLSLVRELVELHGGTVAADSDGPGRGACFVVTLPREGAGAAVA